MKRDFTLKVYKKILISLHETGYNFFTYKDFLTHKSIEKAVLLRHDVDKFPQNSLEFALIEMDLNIKATYYFRIVEKVFDKNIIRKIYDLGHEIGYHYEDLASAHGDKTIAILNFKNNLEKLRAICPVYTICMHGSPMTRWDNKVLWENYSYKDYGILGEPYLDTDFNNVLYITDTGRGWNRPGASIRDKIVTDKKIIFKNSFSLIESILKKELPDKIMITTHPQRWTDKYIPWLYELIWQKTKNAVKVFIKR